MVKMKMRKMMRKKMNKETLKHLWNRKKIELKNGRFKNARLIDKLIIQRISGSNDKRR
jgi:hypothetical protein